ncbi:MAG: hypothetical protein A3H72_00745 [Candidatus Doudnabacteria bacterium RIFCSPLOWO2_02_FULL_48_8]|nr:MAG: hypothetical protein A3H72_00745 [Candidatus Doudnabacteria bacterium RIFCSPLOWO2_02_FULL_48_8]
MNAVEKFFVNSRLQYYLHKWFWFGKFLRQLPLQPYRSILEIGTGIGITGEFLAEKYPDARIIATDFDEDSVETARSQKYSANLEFRQADATKLPFADNQFDAAFSVLTLHHIHNFGQAISELCRVVKQGGDIYIMDIPSASFNFTHFRQNMVPGLFSKNDLIKIGETFGLHMTDLGGRYLFRLQGRKL